MENSPLVNTCHKTPVIAVSSRRHSTRPSSATRRKKTPSSTKICRRRLYTPRRRCTVQLLQASKKIAQLDAVLKKLNEKSERAKRKQMVMVEYRCNLKTATVQSIKCMYEEYIRRKQNALIGHKADACFKETNLEEFITPSKVSNAADGRGVNEKQDVSSSPLAVPLE